MVIFLLGNHQKESFQASLLHVSGTYAFMLFLLFLVLTRGDLDETVGGCLASLC